MNYPIADNPRRGTKIGYANNYRRYHHGRHVILYSIDQAELITIELVLHYALDTDQYL